MLADKSQKESETEKVETFSAQRFHQLSFGAFKTSSSKLCFLERPYMFFCSVRFSLTLKSVENGHGQNLCLLFLWQSFAF